MHSSRLSSTFFFLTDWGPSLAVIKTDRKHFVKNDENNKVFPQKWPAYIWPEVYSLSSGSTTIKTFNFILYIYDFFTPHILQKTFQVWQANNINSPWYRLGTNVFTVLAQCWCKNLHFKSYRSILFMFFFQFNHRVAFSLCLRNTTVTFIYTVNKRFAVFFRSQISAPINKVIM